VARRLEELGFERRDEILAAVREAAQLERQRLGLAGTVELERERRVEAETLREVLEAITRPARLEETIEEVLRQLERVVAFDACSLALCEPERCRVIAARGFPEGVAVVGATFASSPLLEDLRAGNWPMTLADAQADERFVQAAGSPSVRSWAGLPLLVEGEVIGLLSLDRWRVEPFSDEDLQHARAVAFSAGAAIRKAQLLAQVRRYATLMEQVVAVDQAVFGARPLDDVLRLILQGALRTGSYPQGLLLARQPEGLRVAVAQGTQATAFLGRTVTAEPAATGLQRLGPEQAAALGLPAAPLLLVPLPAPEPPGAPLGLLALFDVDGESPDDRLMEAYASRVAAAWRHALVDRG
jgi:hypothetical protein